MGIEPALARGTSKGVDTLSSSNSFILSVFFIYFFAIDGVMYVPTNCSLLSYHGRYVYLPFSHAIVQSVKKLKLYLTTFANECGEKLSTTYVCSSKETEPGCRFAP